jgi:hypothetical protein
MRGAGKNPRRSSFFDHCSTIFGPILTWVIASFCAANDVAATPPEVPAESPESAKTRHERVAKRRQNIGIFCHRGACEHAHENTLEAYRATFELGGDGNEIDIRATKDGVLVLFHDDFLSGKLDAYGDVSEYTWDELQRFRFRDPGRFGDQCRIPTLAEVFELHRKYAGLMHLDIKRPGLDTAIADLLTKMDMWDHVAYCSAETGGGILRDPQIKLRRYKAGLYEDRGEVFPDAIAVALAKEGEDLIVEDPRGVAIALGRKPGKLSNSPVSPTQLPPSSSQQPPRLEPELIAMLGDAGDWDQVAESADDQAASAARILARAKAADELLPRGTASEPVFAALIDRVRRRSLHKDWRHHGLDGAAALRALILLNAPKAVETAKFVVWRDDDDLARVQDKRWNNPRSWTDWRMKTLVWQVLGKIPGSAAERICRDYLALSDSQAREIGPTQFEQAAKTLLAVSPRTETALELMKHRLQVVRGRAILECLAHDEEKWTRAALEQGAPHALAYRVAR